MVDQVDSQTSRQQQWALYDNTSEHSSTKNSGEKGSELTRCKSAFPARGPAAADRRLWARERINERSGGVQSSLEEIDESKTILGVRVRGWPKQLPHEVEEFNSILLGFWGEIWWVT